MKGGLYALATAVLLGTVAAGPTNEYSYARKAFQALMRVDEAAAVENATCGPTTTYSTSYGAATCACMTASAIALDVASIAAKGFSSIRLYSTDCDGLSAVSSAALPHGLKLVLGVYISDAGIADAQDQVNDVISHFDGDYSMVEMVVVGNEAIFNNYCSGAELAAFISSVKATLQAAGYTGPVTTTEPMSTLRANTAELCDVLDVVGANIHAFFHSDITAAQAGAFVSASMDELAAYCPGDKAVWNLETGWPGAGAANGQAVPGQQEQQVAIAAIVAAAGGRSAISSFVNELWKAEGDLGVEQSWGCGHLFG
ncbi:hypothetical protein MMC32_001902 [Xylographa parallela]|nr:hypothetical protein [Xylographa parallela]